MLTDRLEVRLPIEGDRDRFVELFQNAAFMEFSAGVHDEHSAKERFDEMLQTAAALPFAKQPVIERESATIIGYTGAAWFDFEGERRLEYGYRLVPEARGRGYATESGRALLPVISHAFRGEMLAMIDPRNSRSQAVIRKLGFEFWKLAEVDGYEDELYRRRFG